MGVYLVDSDQILKNLVSTWKHPVGSKGHEDPLQVLVDALKSILGLSSSIEIKTVFAQESHLERLQFVSQVCRGLLNAFETKIIKCRIIDICGLLNVK